MFPEIFIAVVVSAFIFEFFDSSVGMGFGTMTPVLVLLGYNPIVVVPAVLFCSAVLSILAGLMHHELRNVNFFDRKTQKILSLLLGFGIAGILIGAFIAIQLPESFLDAYIGLLTLGIGIAILGKYRIKKGMSWKRLIGFGTVASLNKGITGGGFGPVLSGGQILSGIKSKHAVGITSLTEGVLSVIGFIGFIVMGSYSDINWSLIASLLIGGLISLPIAVYALKKLESAKVRYVMGLVAIMLGMIVLLKVFIA